jgi:hypothetical protein
MKTPPALDGRSLRDPGRGSRRGRWSVYRRLRRRQLPRRSDRKRGRPGAGRQLYRGCRKRHRLGRRPGRRLWILRMAAGGGRALLPSERAGPGEARTDRRGPRRRHHRPVGHGQCLVRSSVGRAGSAVPRRRPWHVPGQLERCRSAGARRGAIRHDSDWVFAYQLGGGVAYRVAPGIDITAEYRYFGTENPEFNLDAIPTTGEFEYSSHSVLFGIRYSFNPT